MHGLCSLAQLTVCGAVHEEMRGANGKKLSNNLKGLSKKAVAAHPSPYSAVGCTLLTVLRSGGGPSDGCSVQARMFLELDQNKDAFLAGADIPKVHHILPRNHLSCQWVTLAVQPVQWACVAFKSRL